jgi:hypothetical protein
MSKEDLDAVSNSDGLAKALAVCQVFWLLIQMISRATSGLAVCQLEVATGAFAITTFLTYLFLWQKPQGVSRPIYLEAVRRPTIGEAWELAQMWTRRDKLASLPCKKLEAVSRAPES